MKKSKIFLIPTLFGMFLAGCGASPAPIENKKASIKIEANEYMTTSLKEGEYEVNKAIEFTVSGVNEEYRVSSVKMDEVELPPANGDKYTFTPTEAKEYKLKVATQESGKVVYTFEGITEENYLEKLSRKGTRIFVNNYVTQAGFENVFKDNKFYILPEKMFQVLCRISQPEVWIRRIDFTFDNNKNGMELVNADPTESYSNGVWTTSRDKGNDGISEISFKGTGEGATISKIVLTTVPFVQDAVSLEFNGLSAEDKVYIFEGGPTFEKWQTKTLVDANTKVYTLQTYYLWVEWSAQHKTYYEDLTLAYNGAYLVDTKFYPDPESGLPQNLIIVYTISPNPNDKVKASINCLWNAKRAAKSIKVDLVSANKYVKHFSELDPLGSLELSTATFGTNTSVSIRPKKGYYDLKMIINGTTISKDEASDLYKFVIPLADSINISFTASEGNEEYRGKDVIALLGENAGKGVLLGAMNENELYITFSEADDHPNAQIDSLSFQGSPLTKHTHHGEEGEEDKTYFKLEPDQLLVYQATSAENKPSLFSATITEPGTYSSTLIINKGAYKVEIAGKESTEVGEEIKYEIEGKSSVTIKFTPNTYMDIYAIEVNDKRLTNEQYTLNPDGSISYTFNANAKNYDFFVIAKQQTVQLALDPTSTEGYKIENLPAEPSLVGQEITLKLAPADDSHWLEGKNITVTYNGANLPVNEKEFTFPITPVKGVSIIKVVVTDK